MQENKSFGLSAETVDLLIRAHDGDVALLYIWHLTTGSSDPDEAAGALCRTLREVTAAQEKLERMGLWTAVSAAATPVVPYQAAVQTSAVSREKELPAEPAEELPQYRAQDIVSRCSSDPVFQAVQTEAQTVLGRALSTPDLNTLLGIYDHLGLPGEVVMELLHYCAAECRAKYGDGRRPGMRYIEKEAFRWAREGVLTFEQAEAYISDKKASQDKLRVLSEAVNIHGRALTKTEAGYLNTWAGMGFSAEAISIAYERTVTNTGSLRWNYMNKILESWRDRGLFTPKEIEEKDGRKPAAGSRQDPGKAPNPDDIRGLMDKI